MRHLLLFSAAVCTLIGAPKPSVLSVYPAKVVLIGGGASQRILVLEKDVGNLDRDVTAEATFIVEDPRIARFDSPDRLLALTDGKTRLKVKLRGQQIALPIETQQAVNTPAITFTGSILPILTKRGCNQAECHGGVKGRGGLRLSLNGLDPPEDHRWIVKGGGYQVLTTEVKQPVISRIDPKDPTKSLLLQKPTMGIAHGGGLRFKKDTDDYNTFYNWIRNGAPFGKPDPQEAILRVEVTPELSVLRPGTRTRVIVTGHQRNGRTRDLTADVRYESTNHEVFKVSADGIVEAVNPGESSLLVHAVGNFSHSRIAVNGHPDASAIKLLERNFIDREVFAKLRKLAIQPSDVTTDAEFLRRVCLDITGTLPPPERVREFLASKDRLKREKLIATLLDSPEFDEFWTLRFADLFRVGFGIPRGSPEYWEWIRGSIASRKPFDQLAMERIASEGYSGESRRYIMTAKVPPLERNMAELMRTFMGRRLDCAQCHNHPTENWTQNQFWGLSAFFGRMTLTNWVSNQVVYDDPDGQEVDQDSAKAKSPLFIPVENPRSKERIVPTFPDGTVLPENRRADPRHALGEWMVRHRWFAEAAVNRFWGYFFGRGIVDPVDDFRVTNPSTNPQLLAALADDFRRNGHDIRRLIRLIAESTSYQLSSRTNESNRHDLVNYSHARPRALDAEVLLDAISAVTGVPEVFGGQPKGIRAIQLMSPGGAKHFLDVYGAPQRAALDDRDNHANLRQALHMYVGETYTKKISQPGSRIDEMMAAGQSNREIVENIYLAAFTRYPTATESSQLEAAIVAGLDRKQALEDMVWAIVNAREFSDNH